MKKFLATISAFLLFAAPVICYAQNADNTKSVPPKVTAKAAILMDAASKRVLYQKNAQNKMPMASTTKIMTALLAIEKGSLSDVVKIGPNASGVEGSSIWLSKGEHLTLSDLLYGLMLSSGNDASIAIAEHISGSVDKFVKLMNRRAKEMGAADTNFVNPNGLPDDNHYTTAYDLALISSYAMRNEEFREIVSTQFKSIPWEGHEWDRSLRNKNKLLWQYEDSNGVKTGFTKEAGRCLVSAALREDMQLVSVVLNCPDMWDDSKEILDYGFDTYDIVTLVNKGDILKELPMENAKQDILYVESGVSASLPVKAEEKSAIKTNIKLKPDFVLPIYKGDVMGSFEIFLDGSLICESELIASNDVLPNDFRWNLNNVLKDWNKHSIYSTIK
jgi:D-alanyl-D-alanine carboxypeptidase (penicillin-binding protein 5/6)